MEIYLLSNNLWKKKLQLTQLAKYANTFFFIHITEINLNHGFLPKQNYERWPDEISSCLFV